LRHAVCHQNIGTFLATLVTPTRWHLAPNLFITKQ
jgi:hypothetical protein